VCSYVASPPVHILAPELKAELPLQEQCIGTGESNMSTYKIKHANIPILGCQFAFLVALLHTSILLLKTCQAITWLTWWIEILHVEL
jgi:hypothetical protein